MATIMKHIGTRISAAEAALAEPLLKWSKEQAGLKGASVKAEKQPLLALAHCKELRAAAARPPRLLAAPFLLYQHSHKLFLMQELWDKLRMRSRARSAPEICYQALSKQCIE